MKKRLVVLGVVAVFVMALFALSAVASEAQLYFSSDKNGQNRVTNIQEGDEVWVVVIDNDQNIDCDVRDKMWPDLKIMDPKTGAYIVWNPVDGDLSSDYMEETGADTGVFVSKRSFQIGTRVGFVQAIEGTHALPPEDFQWGNYSYLDGTRGYFDCMGGFESGGVQPGTGPGEPPTPFSTQGEVQPMAETFPEYCGRFENMDTLVGMYQDPNDEGDVAVGMMKIIDTEATISWDQEVYKDANGAATITVVDPDENINCNKVEYVPVFIIVNPGSWNPVDGGDSPTNFCMLKRYGGIDPEDGSVLYQPIRWFNIYDSGLGGPYPVNAQPTSEGAYYIEYPTPGEGNVTSFDTTDPDGYCRVMFYAQETGVATGVFELNLNSILTDLGFNGLRVRDVLVAYYLDPNDFDDFKIATAYIEEHQHSITSFTDSTRADKELYWIGRDPVYVQVIDANANTDPCCPEQVVVHICDVHGEDDSEWIVLDETSSNSPVFFSNSGTQLWPAWDALGVGIQGGSVGGFQLQLDNWKLEAYNEDSVYVRYNDVYYVQDSMNGLGDINTDTAFPPVIDRIRVANDVSFDLMEIADTQVFDGSNVNMYFLDRQGNRVSGYVNSDCVFVEVVDPDQDEDQYRRERIDGYWDGGQNLPFGPWASVDFACDMGDPEEHPVNHLLGNVNIFNDEPTDGAGWAKVYVLNPRSGRWAAVDLLETGVATGDFVSVICIDLTSVYSSCVPTLDVLPGDTIVAVYQDPSNHSDSAWISIKVGIGGGATPPSQLSTTMFVDADGNEVTSYTDADLVYVKVIDPSHAGAALLANAVEIDGVTYDLTPLAGTTDEFITDGLTLGLSAGDTITATYTDPTDPTDTSSDTITIIASALNVERFYAGPSPFSDTTTFGYVGSGIASDMSVEVRDASGHVVWSKELTNVSEIVWDGTDESGAQLANGAYMYVITATDGTNTFGPESTPGAKGWVFIDR